VIAIWRLVKGLFITPEVRRRTSAGSRAKSSPTAGRATTGRAIDNICEHVIACATTVSNTLGSGLTAVVYENALAHELRKAGLSVSQQQAVAVHYDGATVGDYTADLMVENTVMIDLIAVKERNAFHIADCMSYLKATGHPLCLLFNFGTSRLEIKRLVNSP
jgi:GxxExxY protein